MKTPDEENAWGWMTATLLVLVALVHGSSLWFGFAYDDEWTIVQNSFIQTPTNALTLLSRDPAQTLVPDAGRPLMVLTEIFDHALWGSRPFGYHLQNLFWHTGVVVLVLTYARALGLALAPASLAATLVALHPLTAEPVSAINYREDLLVTFFSLLTLFLAVAPLEPGQGAWPRRWRSILIMTTTALAAFAKENAYLLPVLYLAISSTARPGRQAIRTAATIAAPLVAVFAWRTWIIGSVFAVSRSVSFNDATLVNRMGAGVRVFWLSLGKLVLPAGLSPDYATLRSAPGVSLVCAGALLVLISWLWRQIRRSQSRSARLGLMALIAFTPHLGLFRMTNQQADRFVYLPLVFASLAFATRLEAWSVPRLTLLRWGLAVPLGLATIRAARPWASDLAIWTHASSQQPTSSRAWVGLAHARLQAGDSLRALDAIERALALDPGPEALELRGLIHLSQGDLVGASRDLQIVALAPGPPFDQARRKSNLASTLWRLGQKDTAQSLWQAARALSPRLEPAWLDAAEGLFLSSPDAQPYACALVENYLWFAPTSSRALAIRDSRLRCGRTKKP